MSLIERIFGKKYPFKASLKRDMHLATAVKRCASERDFDDDNVILKYLIAAEDIKCGDVLVLLKDPIVSMKANVKRKKAKSN